MDILSKINNHDDLLRLTEEEQLQLCSELREFLVSNIAQTGGHVSGNLGVVELSVALETVYDTAKDRLVFDVGHQSYVHKILTGRREQFHTLRQFGGISGFPKPCENDADAFVAGHASSSVSIALGMARARTLLKEDYQVAALIGDGACTGGMAYEGLNDLAESHEPMVVILNDNEMSIRKNVGGLSQHLSRIRSSTNYLDTKEWYRKTMKQIPGGRHLYQWSSRLKNRVKRFLLPGTLFEKMGLTYLGPVDGHDVTGLISLLRTAKEMRCPVLVHVVTKKGQGYLPAEQNPAKFHGIGIFDATTGQTLAAKVRSYSDSFGDTMMELGERNARICAITAAMPDGTGLQSFLEQFPSRTFDVGIAEEHAVSMAGGLAKQGMVPVVALYSTFLQRGFDQIMQDIALLHLHVVLAIDRAGLVGDDGPTHHGVFDVGFLRQIPGMLLLTPGSLAEQRDMLIWAAEVYDGPVAIRYPRGGEGNFHGSQWQKEIPLAQQTLCQCHREGKDITLLTYGNMLDEVLQAADLLEKENIHAQVLRLLSASNLPVEAIVQSMAGNDLIVVEEICAGSGIAPELALELDRMDSGKKVHGVNLGFDFAVHGNTAQLRSFYGLDAASIARKTKGVIHGENEEET